MKKKPLIATVCLLVFSMTVFFGFNVYCEPKIAQGASAIDEFSAELKKIDDEMKALKASMKDVLDQKNGITAELAALDLQIEQREREQASASSHIAVVEYDIEIANNNILVTEERLNKRQELFKTRLVNLYMNGDVSLLDVLFASSSFKEFVTSYDMIEKVLEQDSALLDSIKEDIAMLNIEKVNLEAQKADWQVLNDNLLSVITDLNKMYGNREAKQKELSTNLTAMAAEMDALERDSAELEKKIEELQRQSTVVYEGIFSWPLPNGHTNITSDYKMRMHPVKKVYKMHTGIDISAAKGTSIYAASSGKVILAQYYSSYGNCVIIDHGDGVSTLYGHMSKIGCKVGDVVKRGETIGYVGTTGSSTGNHLHFEVRINGAHTSPWNYVGKK